MFYSNNAKNMSSLPNEILFEVAKNLDSSDLLHLRSVSALWKQVCGIQIRRIPMTLTFDHRYRLSHFNHIFLPSSLIASNPAAQFCFTFPLLNKMESLGRIQYFGENYGRSVTRLILNFQREADDDPSNSELEEVNSNLTSLLSGVKSTLQELQLIEPLGLSTMTLGLTPFPVLSTLKIRYDTLSLRSEESQHQQQLFLLHLGSMVPEIQILDFEIGSGDFVSDITFLPKFLANLGHQNPNFRCKINFNKFRVSETYEFPEIWLTDTTNMDDLALSIAVGERGQRSTEILLKWIGMKSKSLKKLSFMVERKSDENFGLEFPKLLALEELTFISKIGNQPTAILEFLSAEKFPNVTKLTTTIRYALRHFLTPMPKVRELTLILKDLSGLGPVSNWSDKLTLTFPNIVTLTCDELFLLNGFVFEFPELTRLNLNVDRDLLEYRKKIPYDPKNAKFRIFNRWNYYTCVKPQLTLDQILEIQPSEEKCPKGSWPWVKRDKKGQNSGMTLGQVGNMAEIKNEAEAEGQVGKTIEIKNEAEAEGQGQFCKMVEIKNEAEGQGHVAVNPGEVYEEELTLNHGLEILSVWVVCDDGPNPLDAILYLSKINEFPSVKRLEINLEAGHKIPQIYVEELAKYHEKIIIINQEIISDITDI